MSSASSFGKVNFEKTWQLKATYVEVYGNLSLVIEIAC